jgi:putative endonuclease
VAATAKTWWLYLLACADGRTYAGIALDVAARFRLHAAGKAAKFTRANKPLRILGAQPFASRSQALQAEYALKQLEKAAKLRWARRWPLVDEVGPIDL